MGVIYMFQGICSINVKIEETETKFIYGLDIKRIPKSKHQTSVMAVFDVLEQFWIRILWIFDTSCDDIIPTVGTSFGYSRRDVQSNIREVKRTFWTRPTI
jgi:hypothetical protein